jgi:hypothetical protein
MIVLLEKAGTRYIYHEKKKLERSGLGKDGRTKNKRTCEELDV